MEVFSESKIGHLFLSNFHFLKKVLEKNNEFFDVTIKILMLWRKIKNKKFVTIIF
jgi:hypothetical protein